jgi:hypothetical protein
VKGKSDVSTDYTMSSRGAASCGNWLLAVSDFMPREIAKAALNNTFVPNLQGEPRFLGR